MSLEEELDKLTIQESSNITPSPSDTTDQTSPDETLTTTTSDTVVKRHVSNSSLFENEQHLFDFIDEASLVTKRSTPAPDSPDSLREEEEEEEEGNEESLERGNSVTTFNFLEEDTLETKSSVTDGDEGDKTDEESRTPDDEYKIAMDEQIHEEFIYGCPEDKCLLMSPPEHHHDCCRAETPATNRKGRAPLPPLTGEGIPHPVPPPNYFCEGPGKCQFSIPYPHKNHYHICPQFNTYNYTAQPSGRVSFYQVGYNTNWRKMPDNWVRMKSRYHARGGDKLRGHSSSYAHDYHYGYGKSWLAYAFAPLLIPLRYSLPSSSRSRKEYFRHGSHVKGGGGLKDFDYSLCTCCVCCNCAKSNQTNCCCCYHCTHTTSSCRRSDILRMVPVPDTTVPGSGAIVSILKKKNVDIPEGGAVITEQSQGDQNEEFHPDNKPSFAITGPDCDVIHRDALDSVGNENGERVTASPSVSGPTPTTEPTDLDAVEDVASIIIEG
jgi:hypothetical protein